MAPKKSTTKAKPETDDDTEGRRIARAQAEAGDLSGDDATDDAAGWDDEATAARAEAEEGEESDGLTDWDENEPADEVEVENPADTEEDPESGVAVSGLAAMIETKGDNAEGLEIQQAKERIRQDAISKARENITDDEGARLEQAANLAAKAKEGREAKAEVKARIGGPANMGAPGVAKGASEENRESDAKARAFSILSQAANEKDDRDGWRNSVELGVPVATLKAMVAQRPDMIETGNAPGGTFSPDTGILFRRVKG